MISTDNVEAFLAQKRLAVIGASDDKSNFGGTIYKELRTRGYDAVAVNPTVEFVAGDRCYPDLASVPGTLGGVVVMVAAARAAAVVRECVERGVPRVWLFKGLGGVGAVSDEAIELCDQAGIQVIAGACPLMFLEPVAWFHKIHRAGRRLNGSLARASRVGT